MYFNIINKTHKNNRQENVRVPAEKVKNLTEINMHKKCTLNEIPKKSYIHDRGVPK